MTHYEDTLELQMADEKSSLSVDIRYDFLSSHHLTMEELSEEDDFPRDRTKRAQNEQRHSEWLDSMRWGGPRRVEDPVEGLGDIEKRPHEFFID